MQAANERHSVYCLELCKVLADRVGEKFWPCFLVDQLRMKSWYFKNDQKSWFFGLLPQLNLSWPSNPVRLKGFSIPTGQGYPKVWFGLLKAPSLWLDCSQTPFGLCGPTTQIIPPSKPISVVCSPICICFNISNNVGKILLLWVQGIFMGFTHNWESNHVSLSQL